MFCGLIPKFPSERLLFSQCRFGLGPLDMRQRRKCHRAQHVACNMPAWRMEDTAPNAQATRVLNVKAKNWVGFELGDFRITREDLSDESRQAISVTKIICSQLPANSSSYQCVFSSVVSMAVRGLSTVCHDLRSHLKG